ncbi:transketolase [Fusibacter sp. JL298sf-3]
MQSKTALEQMAKRIRKSIMKMALNSGTKGAHMGGSLSAADILAVLYGDVMRYDAQNPTWEGRDRFIMSKAHSAIGLYAALHEAGFLSADEIDGAMQGASPFFKHPKFNVEKGLEFSGGSLGQGLSLGVGSLLGMQAKGNTTSKVYVMLGDGECDEGSVWEAAVSAAHFGLNRLTAIIDVNGLQNDGTTEQVMGKAHMARRWESVGFETFEVDGHDVLAVREALAVPTTAPKALIAHTRKGKGLSLTENKVEWHIGYFTEEMYRIGMAEIEHAEDN